MENRSLTIFGEKMFDFSKNLAQRKSILGMVKYILTIRKMRERTPGKPLDCGVVFTGKSAEPGIVGVKGLLNTLKSMILLFNKAGQHSRGVKPSIMAILVSSAIVYLSSFFIRSRRLASTVLTPT